MTVYNWHGTWDCRWRREACYGCIVFVGRRLGQRRCASRLALGVVVLTASLTISVPLAAAAVPTISLSASSGSPGIDVLVSGTGFSPGEHVQPVWGYSGPGSGVPQASFYYFNPIGVADASGAVTADFFVPDTTGGVYTVAAVGVTSKLVATATFRVVPRIDIGSSFGSAGTVLNLTGWGLGAKEPLSITWDSTGTVMATATTDGKGYSHGRTFTVPNSVTSGSYGITMTGLVSGLQAHATFEVGPPPQSQSPGPNDWSTFGFDAQQTRAYPASTTGFGTSALAPKWHSALAPVSELDSSVTVSNGVAYVGTVHGTLYAINVATGAVLWTFATHGPIYGSPNIVKGVLYFGTVNVPNEGIVGNYVYALDASTGTQIWEELLPNGGAWYAPTVNAGRVIVPMANKEGQSGGVVAYSATDGTMLWNDNLLEGVWSPASFDPTGTHLYLATGNPCTSVTKPSPGDGCSGSILDIDPTTGSIRWSYRVPDVSGDDDCATAPAFDSGMVFVGCKNGIEYAFNALTGAIIWQFNTGLSGDSGIFSSAAVANGVVYFGAGDSKLHAVSESSGTQLWSYPTKGAVVGSPIVAEGAVYAASVGGTLYALSPSGTLLASAALGGPTLASPSLADGVLYQTVKSGFVDAFTVAPHGPLNYLVLSPSTAAVATGTAQAYTATGVDQSGNSLGDVTASTTFTIAPDGSCTGASCTATTSGPHTVTGTDGTASGTAALTVTPTGTGDHLVLSPSIASVGAGVSQAYTATSVDQSGNSLGDVTASTTFTIAPDGACSGASCSATTTGPHTVTATDGTASGTATLTVKPPTVEDNFQRANTAAGWGTTTNTDGIPNLPWQTNLDGSSPYGFISNQHGVVVYTGVTGHKVAGYINTPPVMGGDTLGRFRMTATDAALSGVIVQHSDASNWYQADIATTSQYGFSKNTLELTIRRAGVMIHAADAPFVVVANTDYWIREVVQVSGGVAHIAARAWADGTPEPNTWMVPYDDTTPLPAGNGGAMGDWLRVPQAGEQTQFGAWSYTSP